MRTEWYISVRRDAHVCKQKRMLIVKGCSINPGVRGKLCTEFNVRTYRQRQCDKERVRESEKVVHPCVGNVVEKQLLYSGHVR